MENHQNLRYLPNKKFILIGIISLLIIGGGFLGFKNRYFKNFEWGGQDKKTQLSVEQPLIAMEIAKNSDNNGSKDWEKTITETINSQNPPANGFQNAASGDQSASVIEPPSTLTEALSQKFFSDFISARNMTIETTGNDVISNSDLQTIVNSFWDTFGNFKETERDIYDKSDIKISSSDDVASIKNYGNSLALIIKKYFDPLTENEMEIFKTGVTNQDAEELKKLEPIINAYRNVAREALSLEVPPSYSFEHLTLINKFNDIADELNLMQNAIDDSARALIAYKDYAYKYGKYGDAMVARFILRDLNNYFINEKKITFENGEPAEFFKIYLN